MVCSKVYSVLRDFLSSLERDHSPKRVQGPYERPLYGNMILLRVGLLASAAPIRGKPHERLNMTTRPIANKYREGKLQRTLKREFKRA